MQDREKKLAIGLGLALVLAAFLMLAGLAVLGYGHYLQQRVFWGLSVQGVPIGGLTRSQALTRLKGALEDEEFPYLRLQAGDQAWIYSASTLGVSLELEEAVHQTWMIGRGGIFREDLVTRVRLLWRGYNVVPRFALEPGLSLKPLRQIALQAGTPARSARVWVAGLDVNNEEACTGRDLDVAAAQAAIVRALTAASGESSWNDRPAWQALLANEAPPTGYFPDDPIPVELTFVDLNPAMAEITAAYARSETILSAPVLLYYEESAGAGASPAGALESTVRHTWLIDRAQLALWLVRERSTDAGSEVMLNRAAMEAFVDALARQIDRPARQGKFDYDADAGALSVREPEQTGRTLDRESALALIEAACLAVRERTVQLPVSFTAPPVTQAQLEALLPLELISTGETSFSGSTEARFHNIVTATAPYQGVVVAPNSRFSFVEHLGDVTIASGYAEGWVIMGNETVLGPGGGVCQVGTTFFRAAFWGGYPIVARTPHAYRVAWYEPPVGLDAAVYTPYVDIQFDNDQSTPILIQTEVDQPTGRLRFRFYGRSPARTVSIEGPTMGETIPPGEPIVEMDPSLAPGQRIQVESAHDGVTVTLYRLIEVGGEVISREPFVSKYAPWPARYRQGPPAASASP